jgi:hypothetical protein
MLRPHSSYDNVVFRQGRFDGFRVLPDLSGLRENTPNKFGLQFSNLSILIVNGEIFCASDYQSAVSNVSVLNRR